ncbi:PAS domain-containing hybrid sensor histidine kinase/response regulator [Asticcacaulis taihuensis]|uniref:PAS domain S-box protein n=1 Tax=Asticcacaulis taihuensis TaxID=260084 RepID=UPI0026EFEECF|nr:PAS domain-containing hybrid sensor histidine kinase/response regulator [Asticcacaulis taihuensis]
MSAKKGFENAEGYLAAIIDSSDDAIVAKTLDGIITAWNRSAERIFGFSAGEAVGQHISLIIPEDRLDEEYIILGKVKAGHRVDHFETIRRAKDGTLIDITLTVSPILADDGRIIGASKVARDIRTAKSAERLSAYLAAIIESSDDAIVSKNLDGMITSWNPSAERIFGYSAEEAIGKHISLIIPQDMIDEEYAILGRVKAGERVDHFETIRRAKNGDLLNISLTVSPIRDGAGRIVGASKVARNITEQKRTIQALAEASKRKDEFLANMSHELRTPLNAIIGLTHLLSHTETLTPKGQQFLTMIGQSSDSLLALINDLLDFSKAEAGSFQFERVDFHLMELVERVVLMQESAVNEKGLTLSVEYTGDLHDRYVGDPLRIQQILTNLLANAVKFTEKGGIDLSVGLIHADLDRTRLVLKVSDTGIGIPSEKLPFVFDKFMQADASTARTHGGSGLGLSICQGLAQAMDGTISVISTPGLGSTFTVDIEVGNSPDAQPIASRSALPDKKNVLIVEDFEPNTVVLAGLLDSWGYSYDIARNGMEGVRCAERVAYDVILMDVQMPGMDGFECTRQIREVEGKTGKDRTPIVAVTAHVFEKDRALCLAAGMDAFLPKPLKPAAVQKILAEAIKPPAAVG